MRFWVKGDKFGLLDSNASLKLLAIDNLLL
jgi:hypothetical protein